MKGLALIGVLFGLGWMTGPAHAEAWCFVNSGRDSFENCGYFSQQQCLAAARGVGGYCYPSPRPPGYGQDSFEVKRWKKGRYPFW
jgi:hypothetical protein